MLKKSLVAALALFLPTQSQASCEPGVECGNGFGIAATGVSLGVAQALVSMGVGALTTDFDKTDMLWGSFLTFPVELLMFGARDLDSITGGVLALISSGGFLIASLSDLFGDDSYLFGSAVGLASYGLVSAGFALAANPSDNYRLATGIASLAVGAGLTAVSLSDEMDSDVYLLGAGILSGVTGLLFMGYKAYNNAEKSEYPYVNLPVRVMPTLNGFMASYQW